MFSEEFFLYFSELYEICKEKNVLNECDFFRQLKRKFPNICEPYHGLQELFFHMLKAKCPNIKYLRFSLKLCTYCKLKHITEKGCKSFVITGGGHWEYTPKVFSDDNHFACYTYGSDFDNSHHIALHHDFKRSGYYCDACIYDGIWDGKISKEHEYYTEQRNKIIRYMNARLIKNYDIKFYEQVVADVTAFYEKTGQILIQTDVYL